MKSYAIGRNCRTAIASILALLTWSAGAQAQEPDEAREPREPGGSLWALSKSVMLDPTTYAPSVIAYDAARLDWDSSQMFFRDGFVERNARYTISGRSNDIPVSYRAGRRRILGEAAAILQGTVVNHLTSHVAEQLLTARYPRHRKLWRTLGWVERLSFASVRAYRLSAAHVRQWRANRRMAGELGLQ